MMLHACQQGKIGTSSEKLLSEESLWKKKLEDVERAKEKNSTSHATSSTVKLAKRDQDVNFYEVGQFV